MDEYDWRDDRRGDGHRSLTGGRAARVAAGYPPGNHGRHSPAYYQSEAYDADPSGSRGPPPSTAWPPRWLHQISDADRPRRPQAIYGDHDRSPRAAPHHPHPHHPQLPHAGRTEPLPSSSSSRTSTLESLLQLRGAATGGGPGGASPVVATRPRGSGSAGGSGGGGSGGRSTPYLTESDRQDIMARIRRGEKQADLAKEYRVSRAAITNLKQRRQMLEMIARNDRDRESREAAAAATASASATASTSTSPPSTNPAGVKASTAQSKRRRVDDGVSPSDNVVDDIVGEAGMEKVKGEHESGEDENEHERGADETESDLDLDNGHGNGRVCSDRIVSSSSSAIATSSSATVRTDRGGSAREHHQVGAQTTSRLLSSLLDPKTADDVLLSTLRRQLRLVLEETIGWSFAQHNADGGKYDPVALVGGCVEAALLAEEFAAMEPTVPRGVVSPVERHDGDKSVDLTVRVPTAALRCNPVLVFLDDVSEPVGGRSSGEPSTADQGSGSDTASEVNSASADEEVKWATPALRPCMVLLRALLACGVAEEHVVVVLNLCDAGLARYLRTHFARVRVVAARLAADVGSTEELGLLAAYRARLRALVVGAVPKDVDEEPQDERQ